MDIHNRGVMGVSRALRGCGTRAQPAPPSLRGALRRSNPVCLRGWTGLLRCARNDGLAAPPAPLRPQIEIALRLELGQTDHAALLRVDEARQEIRERDVLRLHGVAAGGKLDAILGEIADALADVRVGLRPVKRLQRRS